MAIAWDSTLTSVLTNKRRASMLKRFGIYTVGDALTYYPFRVAPPVKRSDLRHAHVGEPMAFVGTVIDARSIPLASRYGTRIVIRVAQANDSDDGASQMSAELVFFTHKKAYASWLMGRLRKGVEAVVCGAPSVYNNTLQFTHPQTLIIGADADSVQEAFERVTQPKPVYHASARLSSDRIHETIVSILDLLTAQPDGGRSVVPSVLPLSLRQKNDLFDRLEALEAVHRPQTVEDFAKGIRTLRYEEALISQLALLQARRDAQTMTALACPEPQAGDDSLVSRLVESLPFELTAGQKSVVHQIGADMAKTVPMRMLLQGEVGSGKTIVALIALLQAVQAGNQAVFIAPTQVLAEQHYAKISSQCEILGEAAPDVLLLTGALTLHERRVSLARIASGEPCIVVATHAAFSKHFQAPNLALVVIDEQHRFGVEQRNELLNRSDHAPHLLVMTATPIPRTAAMTWFGDLELVELAGMPGGRKPVSTFVIPESDNRLMAQMFIHCRRRIDCGERVYVVCPAIESHAQEDYDGAELFEDESAGDTGAPDQSQHHRQLHSVEEITARLAALPQFDGIAIGHLTGRDDAQTKAEAMRRFADGTTPLLVSTTVIEVGVDVPQASCIVIFDADRFGLSQLHQLRGRVGRGGTPGWAFLVSAAQPDSVAAQRMEVIRTSTSGADIAQADIELRGAGDVLGDAQAGGVSSFKLLRVVKDAKLITSARRDAQELLETDSQLSDSPQLAGAVLDFLRGNEKYLTRS